MKVNIPGAFFFVNGHTYLNGWDFDTQGAPVPLDMHCAAFNREVLRTALLHVAAHNGITLIPPAEESVERISFDVEREAADAIAIARWAEPS